MVGEHRSRHALLVVSRLLAACSGDREPPFTFPGADPGSQVWFPVGVRDSTVPRDGICLSNGLVGTVPW